MPNELREADILWGQKDQPVMPHVEWIMSPGTSSLTGKVFEFHGE